MYFDIKKLYYTTSIGCYGFVSKFKILKQNMICFSFEGGGGDIPLWGCTYMVLLLQIEWEKEPK